MNATNLDDEHEIRIRRLVPTPLTTETSAPTHTQERLSWLLDQYLETHSSPAQAPNDISSEVLAQRVFELLSNRNLLDGPLSRLAKPVRTLYPEMPGDVLRAWWEKRGLVSSEPKLSAPLASSPPPAEKENIPPITLPAHTPIMTSSTTSSSIATLPSTTLAPSTPHPSGETIQALSCPANVSSRSLAEEHPSPRTPSLEPSAHTVAHPAKETSTPSRSALSSILNISPYTARALLPLLDDPPSSPNASKRALQPSLAPLSISPQSQKRHKRTSSTNSNHYKIVPDSDAFHDTPTYNDLAEISHDLQSAPTITSKMWKDIGDPVAAKGRFLYERMNIFDISKEWEPTPPQTRMIQREEGEGRMEYLARINLL